MIDKEAFLKASIPEGTVAVTGGDVRVRGLSRSEVLGIQKHADDLPALEKAILWLGFVDPSMSVEEVEAWYGSAPAGDVDVVVKVIADLSGMSEAAPKSGVPGIRSEQGS